MLSSLSPATGPLLAACLLLLSAGVIKLRRPASTGLVLARAGLPGSDPIVRAIGAIEVVGAVAGALLAGLWALPATALYLGFAAFTARQVSFAARQGTTADCGCFGSHSAPVDLSHVAVNLALTGACAWAATASDAGLVDAIGARPGTTAVTAAIAAVAAAGLRALLTDLPALHAARRSAAVP